MRYEATLYRKNILEKWHGIFVLMEKSREAILLRGAQKLQNGGYLSDQVLDKLPNIINISFKCFIFKLHNTF